VEKAKRMTIFGLLFTVVLVAAVIVIAAYCLWPEDKSNDELWEDDWVTPPYWPSLENGSRGQNMPMVRVRRRRKTHCAYQDCARAGLAPRLPKCEASDCLGRTASIDRPDRFD